MTDEHIPFVGIKADPMDLPTTPPDVVVDGDPDSELSKHARWLLDNDLRKRRQMAYQAQVQHEIDHYLNDSLIDPAMPNAPEGYPMWLCPPAGKQPEKPTMMIDPGLAIDIDDYVLTAREVYTPYDYDED